MRKPLVWLTAGVLGLAVVLVWGLWTWQLSNHNTGLAWSLEAERQRNFSEMTFHVEQLQTLLGKGLAAGSTRQNLHYMGEVHRHSQAAVARFMTLPLSPELRGTVGKFLQQTGDFARSLAKEEAAGGEMNQARRAELARLRREAEQLSAQLQGISLQYQQGGFLWNPPTTFNWATLTGRAGGPFKPNPSPQSPGSMVEGGWDRVGVEMGKLPVLLYDGPFSDHLDKRQPAMTGPAVTQEEASRRLSQYVPQFERFRVVEVTETANSMPTWSFRLAPVAGAAGNEQYVTTVEVTKNGGFLASILSMRAVGEPTVTIERARDIGREYLRNLGLTGMEPTYGQVDDGRATIAYALHQNGVVLYPDQAKLKIALDTGEILGVDLRQFLMAHHQRTLPTPRITAEEASDRLNPNLLVQRSQLALIPDDAGTGEILAWEFLTLLDGETFLVYINALNGAEEQILQKIETNGGTFAL